MRKLVLLLGVAVALGGCAGGLSAFHTWYVAHNVLIAEVGATAGAAAAVEAVGVNTVELAKDAKTIAKPKEADAK